MNPNSGETPEQRWTIQLIRGKFPVDGMDDDTLREMSRWAYARLGRIEKDRQVGYEKTQISRDDCFRLILGFYREGMKCPDCGRTTKFNDPSTMLSPSLDHMRAKSVHYKTGWRITCHVCNSLKGDMEYETWHAILGYFPENLRGMFVVELYQANRAAFTLAWKIENALRKFKNQMSEGAFSELTAILQRRE